MRVSMVSVARWLGPALLLVAGLWAGTAGAGDFQVISGNARQILLIDPSVIVGSDGYPRAWTVAIRRASSTAGAEFDYAKLYQEFDCRQRRVGILALSTYRRDGTPLGGTAPPFAWSFVTPESQDDDVLTFVCGGAAKRKTLDRSLTGFTLRQDIDAIYNGNWPDSDH
jgi:hypothetical protein